MLKGRGHFFISWRLHPARPKLKKRTYPELNIANWQIHHSPRTRQGTPGGEITLLRLPRDTRTHTRTFAGTHPLGTACVPSSTLSSFVILWASFFLSCVQLTWQRTRLDPRAMFPLVTLPRALRGHSALGGEVSGEREAPGRQGHRGEGDPKQTPPSTTLPEPSRSPSRCANASKAVLFTPNTRARQASHTVSVRRRARDSLLPQRFSK